MASLVFRGVALCHKELGACDTTVQPMLRPARMEHTQCKEHRESRKHLALPHSGCQA